MGLCECLTPIIRPPLPVRSIILPCASQIRNRRLDLKPQRDEEMMSQGCLFSWRCVPKTATWNEEGCTSAIDLIRELASRDILKSCLSLLHSPKQDHSTKASSRREGREGGSIVSSSRISKSTIGASGLFGGRRPKGIQDESHRLKSMDRWARVAGRRKSPPLNQPSWTRLSAILR